MPQAPSPEVVIYHNARCSKSRSACEIVAGRGIEARIVEYRKTPPSRDELCAVLQKLGMKASELVRRGEEEYKQHYAGRTLTEDEWLDAMAEHPILIERPIVVRGDRAVVGRPPEKVLELLDADD
jgi:arsenate reductase